MPLLNLPQMTKRATKKIVLSSVVALSFVAYAVYQQLSGGNVSAYSAALAPQTQTQSQNSALSQSAPAAAPAAPPSPAPRNIVARKTSRPSPPPPAPAPAPTGQFKDGTYTGSVADAYFGNVQVQAIVKNGQLADVIFLDYPQDRGTSRYINGTATPILRSEAISAQSANVDAVSGATQTSQAFNVSLASALAQAKI